MQTFECRYSFFVTIALPCLLHELLVFPSAIKKSTQSVKRTWSCCHVVEILHDGDSTLPLNDIPTFVVSLLSTIDRDHNRHATGHGGTRQSFGVNVVNS
jgi:hypothetical protein